jgi:hypothetical protein
MSELKDLLMAAPKRSLAVAESLTCGHLQARIGSESGASAFFAGGVTAYTLEQKVGLLAVDRAVAEAVDCVSDEVARQMAFGVCKLRGGGSGEGRGVTFRLLGASAAGRNGRLDLPVGPRRRARSEPHAFSADVGAGGLRRAPRLCPCGSWLKRG